MSGRTTAKATSATMTIASTTWEFEGDGDEREGEYVSKMRACVREREGGGRECIGQQIPSSLDGEVPAVIGEADPSLGDLTAAGNEDECRTDAELAEEDKELPPKDRRLVRGVKDAAQTSRNAGSGQGERCQLC